MELRGHRRGKKPQSGFFSRHYHSISAEKCNSFREKSRSQRRRRKGRRGPGRACPGGEAFRREAPSREKRFPPACAKAMSHAIRNPDKKRSKRLTA